LQTTYDRTLNPKKQKKREVIFILETEPCREPDQVRKPATSVEVDVLVEYEGMEWSSTHTPAAECEVPGY